MIPHLCDLRIVLLNNSDVPSNSLCELCKSRDRVLRIEQPSANIKPNIIVVCDDGSVSDTVTSLMANNVLREHLSVRKVPMLFLSSTPQRCMRSVACAVYRGLSVIVPPSPNSHPSGMVFNNCMGLTDGIATHGMCRFICRGLNKYDDTMDKMLQVFVPNVPDLLEDFVVREQNVAKWCKDKSVYVTTSCVNCQCK